MINVLLADPTTLVWTVIVGLLLALTMFGTSVGSGALTLQKALIAASVFELAGALALGSRVASTLKAGIALPQCFADSPALFMVGMLSALASASTWLIIATLFGLPVSTTHSVVGGIVGMAIALKGFKCVNWGFTGVGKIAISWVTSPILAGIAAFLVYTSIANFVLNSKNPEQRALYLTPFLLAAAAAFIEILTILDLPIPTWSIWTIIAGTFLLIILLGIFFGVPWLRKQINKTILLEIEGENPSIIEMQSLSDTSETIASIHSNDINPAPLIDSSLPGSSSKDTEINGIDHFNYEVVNDDQNETAHKRNIHNNSYFPKDGEDPDERHVELDLEGTEIHSSPTSPSPSPVSPLDDSIPHLPKDQAIISSSPKELEARRAKQVYWWLQNFSACMGSFAHGANDTANAIGPFAAIYFLWHDGYFTPDSEKVPIWIVFLGGVSIVAGLAILGYRVIQTMGTELIHVDYVSGFSSELSSSLTVVMASRLHIPVSSTHCQVGAIIGVGLVDTHKEDNETAVMSWKQKLILWIQSWNARVKNVNWKLFGKIFASWIITVPASALMAAALAFILQNAVES